VGPIGVTRIPKVRLLIGLLPNPQVDDDLFRWRFRVKNFDEDVPAGKQLNRDLQECGRKYGQDYILMELKFPSDYPTVSNRSPPVASG
jgi:hypothetical protein